MSLVFAAVVPHSPILLPSVGREHVERLKKTVESLKRLEQELYAAAPQTILIISPHGPVESEHFTIDVNDRYVCNLKEFGVMESPLQCGADMKLVNDLREHCEDRKLPIMLRSEESLDYGVVVPLTYLAAHLNKISIIPLYPSLLDAKAHFEFGRAIQEVVMNSNRRVAAIASADLSHRLTENAPGGFSPAAKAFDEKIIQLIGSKNSAGLIGFDAKAAREAGECGLSTLVAFAGILDRVEAVPEILSYEGPFGIGYLVAHYTFA